MISRESRAIVRQLIVPYLRPLIAARGASILAHYQPPRMRRENGVRNREYLAYIMAREESSGESIY